MLMEILDAQTAPTDLLPLDVSVRWPHLALFTESFCTDKQLAAMKEFGIGLGLYWNVLPRRINGVDYRVFAFDNAYQANAFAVAFDAMQFDTEKRPALRLEC